MDGVSTSGYAGGSPPSGLPVCTRIADGEIQIVWPSAPADEFSVSETFVIRHIHANVIGGAAAYAAVVVTQTGDQTAIFEPVDGAGALILNATITVEVG